MTEKKYLNEEKYQKTKKNLILIAVLVLIIGLCIGGFLIYKDVQEHETPKVEELKVALETERKQLETKRKQLEDKGVEFDIFAIYTDGEAYDLKIITEALNDPISNACKLYAKDYAITKEYCSALNKINEDLESKVVSKVAMSYGTFICIASFMVSLFIFLFAKGRDIAAFSTQQDMPVIKEGMEEIAPSIGNIAGEIAKGIKTGLDDDEK